MRKCGAKNTEASVETKGRTDEEFPNPVEDMIHVKTNGLVSHESRHGGKHVGIQARGTNAASFYADSSFVFCRNRPVRTRMPGGVGFLLPTSSGHSNAVPHF